MEIKVGTFNLNNLFSRFNFRGAAGEIASAGGTASALTVRYEFTDPSTFRIRTFRGRLIKQKNAADTKQIAKRILDMDLDVLAVQEVENIGMLRQFNRDHLNGLYSQVILIEGNDPRFIDVGVLSKLPIGAVTSHQTAVHPSDPTERVFGRDLLEVQVLNPSRSRLLFTLFNNHLKSQFVPHDEDPLIGGAAADTRRRHQAETVARIVGERTRPSSRFVVLGDMNDTPEAGTLAPILTIEGNSLANGLVNPKENREPKAETVGPGPQTRAWTHRFRPSGQPPRHELFDQIWLSPSLAEKQMGAFIDRRRKHSGDGSDHDPAWVVLTL